MYITPLHHTQSGTAIAQVVPQPAELIQYSTYPTDEPTAPSTHASKRNQEIKCRILILPVLSRKVVRRRILRGPREGVRSTVPGKSNSINIDQVFCAETQWLDSLQISLFRPSGLQMRYGESRNKAQIPSNPIPRLG
jgi:hypothetical protein